ncbi:hypothetical protein [Azospira restricta]|uniref:Uncharacterized protein n=1 Tax=Azospira restricta TaxID=404405 RepID=A0A974SQ36_9RHOO|nr:hypothetical protein [Azospira restricta]QRJ64426.1 hypothetical protein IWH25_03480 [Azospira restricta]
MDQSALSMRIMSDAFGEFGTWLLARVGARKAAITIHRYLPFFMEMEREWQGIPTYSCLLWHFGAERLRRVRLPMTWLSEAKGLVPDVVAREENSEQLRIDAIVGSVLSATPAAQALNTYKQALAVKVAAGKATLRSLRLALRPAASLLLAADPKGQKLPNQAALDRYLLHAPGQKAAITGFVKMLNQCYNAGLVVRVNEKRVAVARRRGLEAELIALASGGMDERGLREKWLPVALAYFYRLPRSVCKAIAPSQIAIVAGECMAFTWNGEKYWIPVPSGKVVCRAT